MNKVFFPALLLIFTTAAGCGSSTTTVTVTEFDTRTVVETERSNDPAPPVTVTVTEQTTAPAAAAPAPATNFSGTGPLTTDKFTLEKGLVRFTFTHNGQGHFGIVLMDSNGEMVDLIANEIGPMDTNKAISVPQDGTYLLDISADGAWSIAVQAE